MRTQRRSARAARPAIITFTFQCTACGAVERRPTPTLPEGWAIEQIGEDIYAYCPDDAIDLPKGGVQ